MKTHPASLTHPWTIRLFVDLDPAGNPIGKGAVLFERGAEHSTLWFAVPEPFDSVADAMADLVTDHANYLGEQPTLF